MDLTGMLDHYGYIVLLVALMLELIAFPLPGELLMTYCGVLVGQHRLNWGVSIVMATAGTIIGVTLSYWIGKTLGVGFFRKYGHYVHLDEARLDKVSAWFNRFGNRLLVFTYFIPGIRHVTGYFSGIADISYKDFAKNSYVGALIWTSLFISIGKLLGQKWDKYHSLIGRYFAIIVLVIALIMGIVYLYRTRKERIVQQVSTLLERGLVIFHSFGRLKFFMVGAMVAFIGLFASAIGIVQDFLANEFSKFDEVTMYIIGRLFTEDWSVPMSLLRSCAGIAGIAVISTIISILILWRGQNKLHEFKFMLYAIIGAELLNSALRLLFHRASVQSVSFSGIAKYTFPGNESMMAIVAIGFLTYIIIRHFNRKTVWAVSLTISLLMVLGVGVSMIYSGLQLPSDVVSGYEFGALWLTAMVIMLEVFREEMKLFNKSS